MFVYFSLFYKNIDKTTNFNTVITTMFVLDRYEEIL